MVRLKNLATRIAATILAAGAAYAAVTAGLAENSLLKGDTNKAQQLNPLSSRASMEASYAALRNGLFSAAEQLATEAIDRSPGNLEAIAVLAFVRERQARLPEARKLFNAAGSSWRVPTAQFWLLQQAHERGDAAEALLRADALLRQGSYEDELFPFLRDSARYAGWREVLIQRLALRPNWRNEFLRYPRDLTAADYEAHEELLMAMRKAGQPPDPEEVAAFIRHLVTAKRYGDAMRVWRRLGYIPSRHNVTDGSFEAYRRQEEEARVPFTWRLTNLPGATISIDDEGDAGGSAALRVRSSGSAVGAAAEQLLVLQPRSYTLSALARHAGPKTRQALYWTIQCVGSARMNSGDPKSGKAGGIGWENQEIRFQVPASNCPAQRLQLRIRPYGMGEVEAWYDNVEIR